MNYHNMSNEQLNAEVARTLGWKLRPIIFEDVKSINRNDCIGHTGLFSPENKLCRIFYNCGVSINDHMYSVHKNYIEVLDYALEFASQKTKDIVIEYDGVWSVQIAQMPAFTCSHLESVPRLICIQTLEYLHQLDK